jgi:tRNA-2-methylthio-N6-dimethylallyladenosine synthase
VKPRYFIETFGCQMNYHDSERLAGLLEREGYERAADQADASLLVVNTCSVREKAEDKLYTELGRFRERTAGRANRPIVAVTGCVAQQEGTTLLKGGSGVDVVVGTQALKRLPELVAEARESNKARVDVHPYEDVSFPLGVVRHSDPVRAWVTVIEGCNEFCAFCVVPYTRGHERMRPVKDVVAEVRRAAETGRVEVQLLGQIVNHYEAPDDASCDFAELLARVSDVPGIERVRFASPHPRHVGPRLLGAMRDLPKVCRHLHLPVQSGSDRILALMRRRYTRRDFLALVERARQTVPGLCMSTDMIVGFPSESDQDFEDTLSLVREARFHSMYSFKYSPRPNTLASKRMSDDVQESVKTTRILALQALQRSIQGELFGACVGHVVPVLAEASSRRRGTELSGRTEGNAVINFAGDVDLIGRIVPVRVTEVMPNTLRGQLAPGALDFQGACAC